MDDFNCRFIKNQYLIEPLRERALQQIKKENNPHFRIFLNFYSPVIDINDSYNVNVCSGIWTPDRNIPLGRIVTRVNFPKSHTIDDLFNILMTNVKTKFILEESSTLIYKEGEDSIYCIQFFGTTMITDYVNLEPSTDKMFRIFNIFTPKFNKYGIFFAYQLKDEKKIAHIFTLDKTHSHPILCGTIELSEIDKTQKISKRHLNIFHRNHKKNREEYEKLE